jgi:hypothetical protein
VHILVGLPIADKAGEVESINPAYSGTLGLIRVGGIDYLYPLAAGTELQVGDSVDTFSPLCGGVEIVDHLIDPEWFVYLSIDEIQKYHTFGVYLNLDTFSLGTLGLVAQFLDQIRPTWKDYVFVAYKELQDTYALNDTLTLAVTLKLYDQMVDYPIIVYDEAEFEGGVADWKYDQGIDEWAGTSAAMRWNATRLSGTATLTNGSTGASGSGTSWVSEIGSGAVSNKYVAVALLTSGQLTTTAGSNNVQASLGSFASVQVGDFITITGEGTFEVLTLIDAYTISVDGPMANSNLAVAWENLGKALIWGSVSNVGSSSTLTFASAFTGTTGSSYILWLIDPDYMTGQYDAFSEMSPDERLQLRITYIGASLPFGPVTVPAPSGSTTHTFTATGETYSVTLAEVGP